MSLVGKIRPALIVHDDIPTAAQQTTPSRTKLTAKAQAFIRENAQYMTCRQMQQVLKVNERVIRRFCYDRNIAYFKNYTGSTVPSEVRSRGQRKGAELRSKEGWPRVDSDWWRALIGRRFEDYAIPENHPIFVPPQSSHFGSPMGCSAQMCVEMGGRRNPVQSK